MWLRVRVSFVGGFQEAVNVIPGSLNVHATVEVFIDSLNVTMTSAASGTPFAASAGSVETMYGLLHAVVKLQGFGTGPATRESPSSTSWPAVISAVYNVHSANGVVWDSVRIVCVPSQEEENVMPGSLKVHVTVGVSIGSLNVTVRSASKATSVSPSAGFVETIYGAAAGHT